MSDKPPDDFSLMVWCPLIPIESLSEFRGNKTELESIARYFDDWRASMENKGVVGANLGELLDRIRILMINVGIACDTNRIVALRIQSILTNSLRVKAIELVSRIYGSDEAIKKPLMRFFIQVRFTRDTDPIEEFHNMPASVFGQSSDDESVTKSTVDHAIECATNILKRLLTRLLSPDPWGF